MNPLMASTHRLISEGGRLRGRHVVIWRLKRKLLHFLLLVEMNHLRETPTRAQPHRELAPFRWTGAVQNQTLAINRLKTSHQQQHVTLPPPPPSPHPPPHSCLLVNNEMRNTWQLDSILNFGCSAELARVCFKVNLSNDQLLYHTDL